MFLKMNEVTIRGPRVHLRIFSTTLVVGPTSVTSEFEVACTPVATGEAMATHSHGFPTSVETGTSATAREALTAEAAV